MNQSVIEMPSSMQRRPFWERVLPVLQRPETASADGGRMRKPAAYQPMAQTVVEKVELLSLLYLEL